jgi:hypothetical protein
MKVKVKKVKRKGLWYGDKIGQIFEVLDYEKDLYVVKANSFYKLYKSDCVVMEEPIPETTYEVHGKAIPKD